MKLDFIAIQDKLFEELDLHDARTSERLLNQAKEGARMVRLVLEELKQYVLENDFESKEQEIFFYKSIFPQIHSRMVYYSRLFRIEADSPRKLPAEYKRFLEREDERIGLFFEEHGSLFIYHQCGASDMDESYFLRDSQYNNNRPDDMDGMLDRRFCNPYSIKLGELIGLEKVKNYLSDEMERADRAVEESKRMLKPSLIWTNSKTDLIELGYALQAANAINHGRNDLKQIFEWLESSFNISLGNPYSMFRDLRDRKGDRTRFISTIKVALEKMMDKMDEDTSRAANITRP